ncbi:histone acetyltransferase taf1 [Cystoisospora suis]|uniref:Histone acetyltransferase taf1 n=1 Tax=Cystoisospora suis TaxID=483139 RepID=A0A2C6KVV9_9APIC|nr:histone acetyltransferase taf1 [Cystoisospora suis]
MSCESGQGMTRATGSGLGPGVASDPGPASRPPLCTSFPSVQLLALPSKHHAVYNGGPPAPVPFSPPSFPSYSSYPSLQTWVPPASHHLTHWQGSSFPAPFGLLRPEKAPQSGTSSGGVYPPFRSPDAAVRQNSPSSYSLSPSPPVLSPGADAQSGSVSKRTTPKPEPPQPVFVAGSHAGDFFPSVSSVPGAVQSRFQSKSTERQGQNVASGSPPRRVLRGGGDYSNQGVSSTSGDMLQASGSGASAAAGAHMEGGIVPRYSQSFSVVGSRGNEQTQSSRGAPPESSNPSSLASAMGRTAAAGAVSRSASSSSCLTVSSSPDELLDILFPSVEASCGYVTALPQASSLSSSPSRVLLHPPAARTGHLGKPGSTSAGAKGPPSPAFQQLKCGLEVTQIDQKELWHRWESSRGSAGVSYNKATDFARGKLGLDSQDGKPSPVRHTAVLEKEGTALDPHEDKALLDPVAKSSTPTAKGLASSLLRSWERFKRRCISDYLHPPAGSSRHWSVEEAQEQVYMFRQFAGVFAAKNRISDCLTLFSCLPSHRPLSVSSTESFKSRSVFSCSHPWRALLSSPSFSLFPSSTSCLPQFLLAEWRRLCISLCFSAHSFGLLAYEADAELERRRDFHVKKVQLHHLQLELRQLQAQLIQHQYQIPKPSSPPSVRQQWRQRRRVLAQRHVHIQQAYRLLFAQVSASLRWETAWGVSPFSGQLVDANELFPDKPSRPCGSSLSLGSLGFPSCCCTESALLAATGGSTALVRGFGCTATCGCRVCIHGRDTGSGREEYTETYYSGPAGSSRKSADPCQAPQKKCRRSVEAEVGPKTTSDSNLEETGLGATRGGPAGCRAGGEPSFTSPGFGEGRSLVDGELVPGPASAVQKGGESSSSLSIPLLPAHSAEQPASDRRLSEEEANITNRKLCVEDQLGSLSPREVTGSASAQSITASSPRGRPVTAGDRPGVGIASASPVSPPGPSQHLASARADLDDEFEFDDADLYDAHQHPSHRGDGLHSLVPGGSSLTSAPSVVDSRSASSGVPSVSPVGSPSSTAQVSGQLAVSDMTGPQQLGVAQQPAQHPDGLLGAPTGFVSGSLTSASGSGLLSCQVQSGLLGDQVEDDVGALSQNHPVVLREPLWGEIEGTLECAMTRVHRLLHWKKKDPALASAEADAAARVAGVAARIAAREAALADGRDLPDEEEEASVAAAAASAAVLTLEEEESALATERADTLRALEAELDRVAGKAAGLGGTGGGAFCSLSPASPSFDLLLRQQQQSERFLFLFLSASFVVPGSPRFPPDASSRFEDVSNEAEGRRAETKALLYDSRRHGLDVPPLFPEGSGPQSAPSRHKEKDSRLQNVSEARPELEILSCVFFDMNDDLLFRLSEELPEKFPQEEEDDTPDGTADGGASHASLATPSRQGVGPEAILSGGATSAGTAIRGPGAHAGVGVSSDLAGAFFESEEALAGVSRTAALRLRRKAKQEVLKLDKQKRIELVKQGKSAVEIHAMAAAEQETRSSKARSPLQEFVVTLGEFSLKEKSGGALQRLNTSFDSFQENRRLHCRGKDHGVRGGIPLVHTKIAFQLQGVHPVAGRRGRIAMLRFHRPDFRCGVVASSAHQKERCSSAFISAREEKRRKLLSGSVGGDGTPPERGPWIVLPPEPSEVVRRLREECLGQHLAAASAAAPGASGSGSDTVSASGVNDDGTGSAVGGGGNRSPTAVTRGGGPSDGSEALVVVSGGGQGGHETVHLANHFYGPQDLSLKDDAPIALFEYIEQQPLVMHNPGMAVRIVRHFFPSSPPHADLSRQEQVQQAERQLKGRLGSFGELRLQQQEEGGIMIFGARLPLLKGQGQAIVESPLLKAPIYAHPATPSLPVKRDTRFHDFRDTDFILVRTRTKGGCKVYLRPLLYPPGEEQVRDAQVVDGLCSLGSPANCTVYTVGQCEPRMEVQAPNSKKHLEDRKLHAKAWALRSVNGVSRFCVRGAVHRHLTRFVAERNVTDMKRIKDLVKQRFCPPVIEKEVTQMLKLLSPIAPHRLPRLDDAAIRSIIRPEVVCCLESAHAALYRLKAIGIMTLTSADGLGGVAQFIEKEERRSQEKLGSAKKRLKEIQLKFRQQVEARLPPSSSVGGDNQSRNDALTAVEDACRRSNAALTSVCEAFSESRLGKRFGHLVRFIEELLLLTPWSLTRECKDVLTNKGSAQFMLTGFGDPSGGRGEGISLIKRLNRPRGGLGFLGGGRASGFRDARAAALSGYGGAGAGGGVGPGGGGPGGGGVAGTGEDLRKLSMQELRRRLLQYGLSESVIRTLPRWDQVALVRQYRDGFGSADLLPVPGEEEEDGADGKKSRKKQSGAGGIVTIKGIRLRAEEYEDRLMEILQRQKAALENDAPLITDTEEEQGGEDDEDSGEDEGKEDETEGTKQEVDSKTHKRGDKVIILGKKKSGKKKKRGNEVEGSSGGHAGAGTKKGAGGASGSSAGGGGAETEGGMEDALLAALDGDEEDREADEDELERRELEVLRQRQEARTAKPLTAEEQQQADMKVGVRGGGCSCLPVQAVPCLRWIRRFRQQAGEPFSSERVVLIYGEQNIRAFILWRTKRLEETRARMMASTRNKEALAGKRVCRVCGQPGHIATNVNCPLYSGPKRPGAAVTSPAPMKKRRKDNQQAEEDLLMAGLYEGGGGSEIGASSAAGRTPLRGRVRGGRGGGTAPSASARGGGASGWGDEEEDDGSSSLVSYSVRRKSGARSVAGSSALQSVKHGSTGGNVNKRGSSKGSRKRAAGGSSRAEGLTGGAEDGDEEDADDEDDGRWNPSARGRRAAVDELNIALARIVNVVLQQQSFKPFWQRVEEKYAPGYYRVIANPMWMQKIALKCKQREYLSAEQFFADVRLIVSNCLLFNPPNSPSAWLRERASKLEEVVRVKFEEQEETVRECEAIIAEGGSLPYHTIGEDALTGIPREPENSVHH